MSERSQTVTPPGQDESERQLEELMLQGRMQNIGHKLLVLSGKGGVGKSTVAANLAVALARAGKVVGLLDVDVHGPSIPKLLALEGRQVEVRNDEMVPVKVSERLSVMSIGLLLSNDSEPVIWRGPRKYSVIRQFLKDVAWENLDYLVVDSPPGTGDEPLSIAQLVGANASAVIVTTPQDLAISDVRRCVSFCNTLSLPIAGIVENMSGYVCPKCGHHADVFKSGGGETLAREVDIPFLGRIPIDPAVVISSDDGTAAVGSGVSCPAGEAFGTIVESLLASTGAHAAEAPSTDPNPKEAGTMKVAIPLAEGRLSMHFGHCQEFAIVEVDASNKKILGTTTHTPPAHEPGVLPNWLHEQGVSTIIAGGMGQRAQQIFADKGIAVVVGAPAENAETLVKAWLDGSLESGDNICDH
jgi:ATP-binding protein involved in chromosome partitioning